MLQEYCRRLEAGHSLTEIDAESCLSTILSGDCEDAEIAKLLLLLSDKGETVDEITGFARVMRQVAVRIGSKHTRFVDTAGTGGGVSTFNVSTAAAFVISAAGVPVAKHGNRAVTSKAGSADVLEQLGVQVGCEPEVSEQALNEIGLCFMFAPSFHPAMKRVAQIRRDLGRRTIFNLLGPLTNPASAPFQLIGVFSADLTSKLAEALGRLGCERAWVVHGNDGMDEISVCSETHVAEVNDRRVRGFTYRPESLASYVPEGGSPEENARVIRGVLDGGVGGPARDLVVLNAAAAVHIATEMPMEEAVTQAVEVIESGLALEKLGELVEAYS
jgi:anthranilate phosphoribosyltransferase